MTHHPKPKDLTDLIQISINANNRVYERNIERPRNFNRYYQNNNINTYAMEIDSTSIKRSPITAEEYKRRIDNNLCLYYTSSNHYRIDYTTRLATEQHAKNYLSATTTIIPDANSENY